MSPKVRFKEYFDHEYSKLYNMAFFEIEKRNSEIINLKDTKNVSFHKTTKIMIMLLYIFYQKISNEIWNFGAKHYLIANKHN
ncbi:hypothetical protein BpHYR1_021044 [Brachionus plicatilis]|uniref:Uncharacterized protein n=1 Tax=Brachionus plicatilis TaxID=10195 RepID=A0A3M7QZC8_BRAPC|nr:hypothetical protein BpHYR1_021044 [Brachionus plicatilis]